MISYAKHWLIQQVPVGGDRSSKALHLLSLNFLQYFCVILSVPSQGVINNELIIVRIFKQSKKNILDGMTLDYGTDMLN
jgi:hypothetical protein